MKIHRWLAFLLAICILLPLQGVAREEEEEIHYSDPPPRTVLTLASPADGKSWEKGGKLTISATCEGAEWMQATLLFPDGSVME